MPITSKLIATIDCRACIPLQYMVMLNIHVDIYIYVELQVHSLDVITYHINLKLRMLMQHNYSYKKLTSYIDKMVLYKFLHLQLFCKSGVRGPQHMSGFS